MVKRNFPKITRKLNSIMFGFSMCSSSPSTAVVPKGPRTFVRPGLEYLLKKAPRYLKLICLQYLFVVKF